MASDWLAAVLPANQMPVLKMVTWKFLSKPGPRALYKLMSILGDL